MSETVKKIYSWWLDYLYVAFWQIYGFIFRDDAIALLSPAGTQRQPVVLIPGIYENWQFMKPIARELFARGHPIHVIEKLGYNTGDIQDMAQLVHDYIKSLHSQDVIIVAHSKGGLIAKYVMSELDTNHCVRHAITINTPFSGSRYAYLFLLKSVRAFAPTHEIIRLLQRNQSVNAQISSIYSSFDPHIPESSFLDGAENIKLPLMGHFRPIGDKILLETVVRIVNRIT